ncbi:MAG: MBL fold metallo-hydrolase RNA specificity domain-containing protein, partial [Pirellulaceae bacterium]
VAAEIRRLGNYSAHADQGELIDWVIERGPATGGLFLNHGDDDARQVMRDLLATKGVDKSKIFMPAFDETFELVAGDQPISQGKPEPRIDVTELQRDWHNDYAAFVVALSAKLDEIKDHQKRRELIAKVSAALDG